MGKTYYEILGVAENATAAEIEAAFKAKAREVHPDTVPAENTYLRKVAAEAFKDLSEAKATLLDVRAREKYDAGLIYGRGSKQAHEASTGAGPSGGASAGSNASSRSSTRSRASRRSRSSSRSQTRRVETATGVPQRARRTGSQLLDIKNLNSFLFMVLGLATIFFLVVLVSSGRMPPLWLATLTACLGILSFVNGMRPHASTIRSGRMALVLSAILVAIALCSLLLLSPSYLEIAIARKAEAAASRIYKLKTPGGGVSHVEANGPTVAVVDESGADAGLPTKIWTNLKDGQNYRTRVNGDTLSLEAIDSRGKTGGEIAGCEFHRASEASSWAGTCSERGAQGEAERKSSATLSSFTDVRIEGSTSDIPVFVMTPVDALQMGTTPAEAPQTAPPVGPVAEGENIAEPDLSGLKSGDREAIQMACGSDKLMEGPEKYNECLRSQVDELKKRPNPPRLSRLSGADRNAVEFACTGIKMMQGPGAYNECLAKQMQIVKKRKR